MNPTFRLVLKSGPKSGQIFELGTNEVIIGRDVNANFMISDPEVSRRHSRVYQQGANYVIEDLGSTNGTVVNGQRLAGPYILSPGEIIVLGEHTQVLFEKVVLDPDATIASFRPVETAVETPVPPSEAPAQVFQSEPDQAVKGLRDAVEEEYVGRVPGKPRKVKPAGKKKNSSLVVILIVVVVVLACGCIAFAIFDALNLYCEIPNITNFIFPGACPP